MLDLAGFRVRFPEFKAVADGYLLAKLADASVRLSPAVFGARVNEAHGWLAAHLAASAPWGYQARLQGSTDGSTVYSSAFDLLVRECAAGFGVT
jgi:hypothetical protein